MPALARTGFSPRIETLDERSLLSVSLTNGLLEVVGTTGADSIRVTQPTVGQIRVNVDNTGEVSTFPLSAVNSVLVRALGGDDGITIGASVTRPVEVRAWAGNDTITGGPMNDTLLGGGGDDLIWGNGGNDTIIGQLGNDHCYGDAGWDTIYGDAIANALLGGLDYLVGGDGDDRLLGGFADDTFVLGIGFDDIDGGVGADHYLKQGLNDAQPIPFTTDFGLPLLGNDFWDSLDFDQFGGMGSGDSPFTFDPYSDPFEGTGFDPYGGFDPYSDPFGSPYSPYGGFDPYSNPYSPLGGIDYGYDETWDSWLYDLATTNFGNPFSNYTFSSSPGFNSLLDPDFFDNLGWDDYFLGESYRPVRTINDLYVLTTGQSASFVNYYDNGYQIGIFNNLYQTGAGLDLGSYSGGANIAADDGGWTVGTIEMPGTITMPEQIPLPQW